MFITDLRPPAFVLRFFLGCISMLSVCAAAPHSSEEPLILGLSPLMHFESVTLSQAVTKVKIDLSHAKEQLRNGNTGGHPDVVLLCFLNGRCALKRSPSWQVYLSRESDIQLAPLNPAWKESAKVCKTNPNYLGDVKFSSTGLWSRKTVHTMMAVHKELLESLAENDGRGFLTFVLNPDTDAADLEKNPVVLTEISLQSQSAVVAEP
jgi:hypothetical protein